MMDTECWIRQAETGVLHFFFLQLQFARTVCTLVYIDCVVYGLMEYILFLKFMTN